MPIQKCVTGYTRGLLEAEILLLMGPAAIATTWGNREEEGGQWNKQDFIYLPTYLSIYLSARPSVCQLG